MTKRLFFGCALALVTVAGCGGGDTPGTDAGPGTDTGPHGTDTGVDAATDAFVAAPDTSVDSGSTTPDAGTDTGSDAGVSSGCELGNTYPPMRLALFHDFPALPVGMSLAPGRDDLFVVLRRGEIWIAAPATGNVGATPFLDMTARLGGTPTGMAEWGLLGLAFHPDYATNGLFYVAYTARSGSTVTDCGGATVTGYEDRIAVGTRSTTSPDVGVLGADIFTIPDPASNHNGGQLSFGPDGYLYYGVGDGGEQGDPCHRAPDTSLALGKIHRFQVGPGIATYNPAPGNPFIGGGGLATIWAYGLRNPWRFTWDRQTSDMYVADVGQNHWEEIDFLPAGTAPGTNFGWSVCEGTHDFNGTCASLTGDVLPIAEYAHSDPNFSAGGNGSITGGFVYRGSALPGLRGAYLFADEVASEFGALRNCPGMPVTATHITFMGTTSCGNPVTFGEDRNGELLVSCYADTNIYRIVAP